MQNIRTTDILDVFSSAEGPNSASGVSALRLPQKACVAVITLAKTAWEGFLGTTGSSCCLQIHIFSPATLALMLKSLRTTKLCYQGRS